MCFYSNGSVVIIIRLVFPNLKSVPSESDVLQLANTHLDAPGRVLNRPVMVDNITYEKISGNSIAVIQRYEIPGISMSENPQDRNETNNLIKDALNNLLNGILTKPGEDPFTFPPANYTNTPDQIEVSVEYVYREGDISEPSDFLSAILAASGSNGSVVIIIRLVFPNLKSVPSESEVLQLANTHLDAPGRVLNRPVMVDNITYEKISGNSIAIVQRYEIPGISMSENPQDRNETNNLIKDALNNLLNGILTKPGEDPFTFPPANYTNGSVVIIIRLVFPNLKSVPSESEVLQLANTHLDAPGRVLNRPVMVDNITYEKISGNSIAIVQRYEIPGISMSENPQDRNETNNLIKDALNNLLNGILTKPGQKPFTFPPANYANGSVVIIIRLVFPNLKSVPSESEVLQLANTHLDAPGRVLNRPVMVDNITYEKISGNSIAIVQRYEIPGISMSENPQDRNETNNLIKDALNNLLNGILTKPGQKPFTFPPANYANGSVVIIIRLVFPNLKSVPSESEVLQLANTHLDAPGRVLNRPVMVDNITYEKISGNSIAIVQRYEIPGISMSENPQDRNETNNLIKDALNNLLNGILTKPGKKPFDFPPANYTNTADQIEVSVEYVYREGDISKSSDFLSAILAASDLATTAAPTPTPTLPGATTAPATINGSVVIIIRLVFPNLKSVPSESEVLQLANTHLDAPGRVLNRPVMVDNITYENLATTAAPTPTAAPASQPPIPVAPTQPGATNAPATISGSVVIIIRLVFPNLKSVPSENEVVKLANSLLDRPGKVLNRPVKLNGILTKPGEKPFTFPPANYTNTPDQIEVSVEYVYREDDISEPSDFLSAILAASELSDHSFAMKLSYMISDVPMNEEFHLRNETQQYIQDSVNTLLNQMLNKQDAEPFTFPSPIYTHRPQEIHANVTYVFREDDISQPSPFLSAIMEASNSTLPAPTTEPPKIVGSVVIFIRFVFFTKNPVPSKNDILKLVNTLLDDRIRQLRMPVRVNDITYEKLSDHSFAMKLSYKISDVSMNEQFHLRNETQQYIQDSVNTLLNQILNKQDAEPFTFPPPTYTNMPQEIHANVTYVFREDDISQPSPFLSAIMEASNSTMPAPTTEPPKILGSVVIFIRFVFVTKDSVPSKDDILNFVNTLLDARIRQLRDPVRVDDIIYEKLSDNSFAIKLSYKISDVVMNEQFHLRNETQQYIQDSVNKLLNTMLNNPEANPFTFPSPTYTNMPQEIHANVEYVFREGDISQPSSFLSAILQASGLATTAAPPTTTNPVLLLVTGSVLDGSFPGWALAIIIPCGIVLILVPFWILLCCLLCGVCAAIKRRLRRRYRIQQYRTHPVNQYRIHPL
ncbi:hypothetical protein AGOR_G00193290 [Albula goreensis]|uniref:Uncharacterized protein n=1 Tax=Albula goreensis TaxID=1534307 RepID=A0A8T3CYM0_9TELE|nr:hypothetical protein AGOR_G00193290 [Albula goreensis]